MAKDTKSNEAKTKKTKSTSTTNTAKKTSAAQTKSAPKKKVSTTTKKSTTTTAAKTKKAATPKKTTASATKAKTTTTKTTKPKTTKASTAKRSTQSKAPKSVEPKKKRVLEETENTPEVVKELHIEEEPKIVTSAGETKSNEEYIPKTLLGADLPEGAELEARRARKRSYSKDALLFAIIIPVLDLLAMLFIDAYKPILLFNDMVVNYIITLILDFILIYIVTYLIDFVMGEDAVKKNRK